MKAKEPIAFRPHHILCTLCFQGSGYSSAFIANYQKIVDILCAPEGDATPIHIVRQADSICSPCPHRRETLCDAQDKVDKLDKAHAEVLSIKLGDRLTWGEAKLRVVKHMSLASFNTACAPCGWKSLGLCEAALRAIVET